MSEGHDSEATPLCTEVTAIFKQSLPMMPDRHGPAVTHVCIPLRQAMTWARVAYVFVRGSVRPVKAEIPKRRSCKRGGFLDGDVGQPFDFRRHVGEIIILRRYQGSFGNWNRPGSHGPARVVETR